MRLRPVQSNDSQLVELDCRGVLSHLLHGDHRLPSPETAPDACLLPAGIALGCCEFAGAGINQRACALVGVCSRRNKILCDACGALPGMDCVVGNSAANCSGWAF